MDCDFPKPAQVNLQNKREIILHIRALLDLHDLLEKGLDAELLSFRKLLEKEGWGKDRIDEMLHLASMRTRYEGLLDPMWRGIGSSRRIGTDGIY